VEVHVLPGGAYKFWVMPIISCTWTNLKTPTL